MFSNEMQLNAQGLKVMGRLSEVGGYEMCDATGMLCGVGTGKNNDAEPKLKGIRNRHEAPLFNR